MGPCSPTTPTPSSSFFSECQVAPVCAHYRTLPPLQCLSVPYHVFLRPALPPPLLVPAACKACLPRNASFNSRAVIEPPCRAGTVSAPWASCSPRATSPETMASLTSGEWMSLAVRSSAGVRMIVIVSECWVGDRQQSAPKPPFVQARTLCPVSTLQVRHSSAPLLHRLLTPSQCTLTFLMASVRFTRINPTPTLCTHQPNSCTARPLIPTPHPSLCRAAFEWIHANIASFGGDPTRVTAFGQSAGAMSIATHLSSPGSKGIFSVRCFALGLVAHTSCWLPPLHPPNSSSLPPCTVHVLLSVEPLLAHPHAPPPFHQPAPLSLLWIHSRLHCVILGPRSFLRTSHHRYHPELYPPPTHTRTCIHTARVYV
jgi:hypothetical protein